MIQANTKIQFLRESRF